MQKRENGNGFEAGGNFDDEVEVQLSVDCLSLATLAVPTPARRASECNGNGVHQ